MGASDSKQNEMEHLLVFSESEKHQLKKLFHHIVGTQNVLTEPVVQKHNPVWLDHYIASQMFHIICNCCANMGHIRDMKVKGIQFGQFLAGCLKGTYTEKTDIITLFSGVKEGQVKLYKLYQTVRAIIKSYCSLSAADKANKCWNVSCSEDDIVRLSLSLLGLNESEITEKDEREKCFEEAEIWLSKCPMLLKMYDRVFLELFPVIPKDFCRPILQSFLPVVSNIDWSKKATVLDQLSVSFINYHLPGQYQSIWRLLYSNTIHGDSFSQLVHLITEKGPTVIIVQGKDGHMFGGFASVSWVLKPSFYGSSECFLFTLKPHYAIYNATSYNDHFMYLNQGQETLPNGLGMGGQLDYYGMWIDQSFNKGHSKAVPKCTTFGSPQLSASPEFTVVNIEVWGIGPEKTRRDSEEVGDHISILDKDATAKAILELAGKTRHSEGVRDMTEDEEMSEEMKQKMNVIPKMF